MSNPPSIQKKFNECPAFLTFYKKISLKFVKNSNIKKISTIVYILLKNQIISNKYINIYSLIRGLKSLGI